MRHVLKRRNLSISRKMIDRNLHGDSLVRLQWVLCSFLKLLPRAKVDDVMFCFRPHSWYGAVVGAACPLPLPTTGDKRAAV